MQPNWISCRAAGACTVVSNAAFKRRCFPCHSSSVSNSTRGLSAWKMMSCRTTEPPHTVQVQRTRYSTGPSAATIRLCSTPSGRSFSMQSASTSQPSHAAGTSSAERNVLRGSPAHSSRPVRRSTKEEMAPPGEKRTSAKGVSSRLPQAWKGEDASSAPAHSESGVNENGCWRRPATARTRAPPRSSTSCVRRPGACMAVFTGR